MELRGAATGITSCRIVGGNVRGWDPFWNIGLVIQLAPTAERCGRARGPRVFGWPDGADGLRRGGEELHYSLCAPWRREDEIIEVGGIDRLMGWSTMTQH